MTVRLPVAIVAVIAAFAGGVASSSVPRLFERDAHAQPPAQAVVYLPADGLAFRAPDGRLVARISYDARGGSFEVFDNRERPAGFIRAGYAPDRPVSLAAPPAAPMATAMTTMPPGVPDLGY